MDISALETGVDFGRAPAQGESTRLVRHHVVCTEKDVLSRVCGVGIRAPPGTQSAEDVGEGHCITLDNQPRVTTLLWGRLFSLTTDQACPPFIACCTIMTAFTAWHVKLLYRSSGESRCRTPMRWRTWCCCPPSTWCEV